MSRGKNTGGEPKEETKMPWGFFALVFVVSLFVGAGVASSRKQRRPSPPPEELN